MANFKQETKMLTPDINPLTKTRYLVVLPDELDIKPFQISKFILPSMHVDEISFEMLDLFGIGRQRMGQVRYSDCEMEFLNTKENFSNKKLIEFMNSNQRSFDFRVELLDPLGMVNEEYLINGFPNTISFSDLSYGDDDLFKTKVTFSINRFTIK